MTNPNLTENVMLINIKQKLKNRNLSLSSQSANSEKGSERNIYKYRVLKL